MILVNTLIMSDFNEDMNNNQQHDWSIDETNILTSDIDPYLTDYIISGTGDNQEVRIYALNNSFSNDNNQNSFDIPSMSTTESTIQMSLKQMILLNLYTTRTLLL